MDRPEQQDARCSVAAQALQSWGSLRLRARGTSMLPAVWPGDVLTLRTLPFDRTMPGDLVLYMRRGRFFVHRVVRKSDRQEDAHLITRGDCMRREDAPVLAAQLLGKVTEVRRTGLPFSPGTEFSFFRRMLAWTLCRSSFLQRAALWLHHRCERHRSGSERLLEKIRAARRVARCFALRSTMELGN